MTRGGNSMVSFTDYFFSSDILSFKLKYKEKMSTVSFFKLLYEINRITDVSK